MVRLSHVSNLKGKEKRNKRVNKALIFAFLGSQLQSMTVLPRKKGQATENITFDVYAHDYSECVSISFLFHKLH